MDKATPHGMYSFIFGYLYGRHRERPIWTRTHETKLRWLFSNKYIVAKLLPRACFFWVYVGGIQDASIGPIILGPGSPGRQGVVVIVKLDILWASCFVCL